jgi:hypothetical protein
VMKKREELLTNFKFFLIPMVEMLKEEIRSLCNFSFLKIVKIEPTIKVQILRSLASWKTLLIPYVHNFFIKINIHHHLKPSCPEQQWPKFGHYGPLGVNRLLPCPLKENLYKVLSTP